LLALALDRSLPAPLQRQLYAQIREAVLAGRLSAGSRLPSTRILGQDLGCSRNTVIGAFDQLLAEGYLESRGGSGTYVTRVLPEALLSRRPRGPGGARPSPGPTARSPGPALSPGGGRLAAMGRVRSLETGAFAPGMPDLSLFPFAVWARLLGRAWRRPALDLTAGGDPAGYPPLRAAIARYLAAVRDVVCSADEVLVTGGAQPALDLVARLLLAPGDEVWIEEPGYPGLRGPLAAAGARLVPVPLDEEGLSVAAGRARAPKARLAVVAPSHQYPLGTTMSLARRLDLLEWAREANAWIVEDDYDSEYRYAGRPLASLQGLEAEGTGRAERVIYIGTFSKVLFPALRFGYLVVPPAYAPAFIRARTAVEAYPSAIVQPVLSAFLEEGHFAAHVRRMRTTYAHRQTALLAAGARHLDGLATLAPAEAGLHLVASLKGGGPQGTPLDDREAQKRAAAAGIVTQALSNHYLETPEAAYPDRPPPRGLMLGYAAVPEPEVEPAVARLAEAVQR
jgi:GntR family transcriptional regulator/MocR family aminotransferase